MMCDNQDPAKLGFRWNATKKTMIITEYLSAVVVLKWVVFFLSAKPYQYWWRIV